MSRRRTRHEEKAGDKENSSTPQIKATVKSLVELDNESLSVRKSGRVKSPKKRYSPDRHDIAGKNRKSILKKVADVIDLSESEDSQNTDSGKNIQVPRTRKSSRKMTPNKKYYSPDEDSQNTDTGKNIQASDKTRKPTRKMTPNKKYYSPDEDSQNSDSGKNTQASDKTRKSSRKMTPNKKYLPDEFLITDERPTSSDRSTETDLKNVEGTDDSDFEEISEKVKATTLFEERVDIEGQNIYGFKTPKKRDAMNLLATNTPKTPKTPLASTSKSGAKSKITKTPHRDRTQLKKKITKLVQYDGSSDSDFSASESDFVPSSSSSSSNEEQDDGDDEEVEEETKKPQPLKIIPIVTPSMVTRRGKGRPKADLQYVLQSDEYFSTHASTKTVTSDHTLDRLKTPRLPHDRLFGLLRDMKVSKEHEKAIQELQEDYKSYFNKWLYLMNEGFNILLYGLGSKRNLLKTFHSLMLKNQPVIVVNGFFPSLTIKDILDSITDDILDMSVNSSNLHEIVDIIQEEFRHIPDTHLFLIVHNLDGTMLRNGKAQNILSRLAKIDNIHLLGSIDHINTPLIWDTSKLSNYNFSWWDTTTMLPYADETAYENSLLVQNSGSLALSSMKNVFLSLTTNAKGIFMVIVKNQMKNRGNQNYQGLAFKDLYWSCREAFLVSSDLALRAQLTEFLDHKLVKMKRGNDGIEHLNIPIEHGLLQQFIEQENA